MKTPPPFRPYDSFAAAYDATGFSMFGRSTAERLVSFWKTELPQGAWVLDLGSGQGSSAAVFAKAGYRVVGLDLSFEMLARARGSRVQADMRRLPLRAVFDAAICLYDAVNHLPPPDLARFFGETAAVLKPGAKLAFDVNTLEGSQMWVGESFAVKKRGLDLRVSTQFDPRSRHMLNRVLGTVTEGRKKVPVDETIEEWYHPRETVEKTVQAAGFAHVDTTDVYMDSDRPDVASKLLYEWART